MQNSTEKYGPKIQKRNHGFAREHCILIPHCRMDRKLTFDLLSGEGGSFQEGLLLLLVNPVDMSCRLKTLSGLNGTPSNLRLLVD